MFSILLAALSRMRLLKGFFPISVWIRRMEIVYFEQQATFFATERTVFDMRRPAGIGHRAESLVHGGQSARNLKNLFPVFVFKWFGGKRAWFETEQSGTDAPLVFLIQMARKNLLLDAFWIPGNVLPAI